MVTSSEDATPIEMAVSKFQENVSLVRNFFETMGPITHPIAPNFFGEDYENPKHFLEDFEKYASKMHIKEKDYVEHISRYLRNSAAEWFLSYMNLPMEKNVFFRLFLNKYDSIEVLAKLNSKAFTEIQEDTAEVGPFIMEKYLLLHRLHPQLNEAVAIEIIKNLMYVSYKMFFSSDIFENVVHFVMEAQKFETEIRQIRIKRQR